MVDGRDRAAALEMADRARTLAFLFTDIEGSTRLWDSQPEAMRISLTTHDRILREAVEGDGGQVVKTTGDGVMAVFGTARDGVAASLAAQRALAREDWGPTGPLRVRMGLHVGEAEVVAEGERLDFHGQAVNRAARIMAAGSGGQALLSAATAALVIDRLPDGASLRDLGEHRLKDLARPEHVYELVHPDLPATTAALRTEDDAVRVLPAEPSTFIGRERERAQVVAALEDPSVRLLTLTGPGGIGKTRLALRAAADVEQQFAAGAAFVDLATARDTSAVLAAISRALGLPDATAGSQLDELTAGIGRLGLLVILDNFEQVTASAPVLSQLLAACPAVKLLVTSREALHVRGERLIAVPPLDTPVASRVAPSAAEVAAYASVRLFVERAKAIEPDFEVTDANAAVLAEICERLEGVPLAIELATARLRVFSLEVLRDRLSSRLGALGGGARDLPERQRTLRATIEWSFQLLPPGEQHLLEVLSCFSGMDMAAVEGVSGRLAAPLSDVDPIDGLASLVDKSLLRRVEDATGPRFAMLESVREFAAERLEASSDAARAARSAHADHYARWASDQSSDLAGPGRPEALERLAVEIENLRLAWRCGMVDRDLDRLLLLIPGMRASYEARGWYQGLIGLTDDMLALIETLPSPRDHWELTIKLRNEQARALSSMVGYTDEVAAVYDRFLASLEGAEVPQVYPILRSLASLHSFRNEQAAAADLGRRILALAEQEGDISMRVAGHTAAGAAMSFTGRITDGLAELESGARLIEDSSASIDWYRAGPDPRVTCLSALSLLLWWEGSIDASSARSLRAVSLAKSSRHPSTTGYGLHHASLLRLWRGEAEEARDLAVQSIEMATEHDLHIWRAVGTVILGAATVALGHAEEGLRWVWDGLERYRGLKTPPVFWPFMLGVTADACVQAGETAAGLTSVDEAIEFQPAIPDLRITKGDLLAASDRVAAIAQYEQAWAMAQGWGARTPALRAAIELVRLGRVSSAETTDRRARLRDALGAFTEGLGHPMLVEARDLLADGADQVDGHDE